MHRCACAYVCMCMFAFNQTSKLSRVDYRLIYSYRAVTGQPRLQNEAIHRKQKKAREDKRGREQAREGGRDRRTDGGRKGGREKRKK